MQRSESGGEVVYSSTVPAEWQLARMIREFAGIQMTGGGVGVDGQTFHLTIQDAEKFEREALEWGAAAKGICQSFPTPNFFNIHPVVPPQ